MERREFPSVNEVIAGHFLRHSVAYYQWRVKDRSAIPLQDRTPADFDDLAVAFDKIGEHEQAIATIRQKIKRFPSVGRYESHANLGTFLIHAGQLEKGLIQIDRAIEINPDAHFGREKYQRWLVEYLLQHPINEHKQDRLGFAQFLGGKLSSKRKKEFQNDEAITGIIGMMRFGNHESPVLLEALADLLAPSERDGAKRLAARALLRASYIVKESERKKYFRTRAEEVLKLQVGTSLTQLEKKLSEEIKIAERFAAEIAADEVHWIETGADVDAEFAKKYYEEPQFRNAWPISFRIMIAIVVILIVVVISAILIRKRLR